MVTVSNLVEKFVNDRHTIYEAIDLGIVSYGNLAEQLLPEIEKELGKKVKQSAIVMALRRYAEKVQQRSKKPTNFKHSSEVLMKTNLCDICIVKSNTLFSKLRKIKSLVDYERGDILNIIHGNYEVSIVTNMKYKKVVLDELKEEKVENIENNLVSLSLTFSKEFMYTPGIIFHAVRYLSFEGVNIFELVSTLTELTFIIAEKDAVKGYNALKKMVG